MKKITLQLLTTAIAATILFVFTGCETIKTTAHSHSFKFDPPDRTPKDPSAVKIKISTGAQRLYVVEGNEVLVATPITVGTAASPTPQGDFEIYLKDAKRRRASQPDAGYPTCYWMEFKPAYGLHWGFVKPTAATHGCVRMPLIAAKEIFAIVPVGTPVNIAKSQPWECRNRQIPSRPRRRSSPESTEILPPEPASVHRRRQGQDVEFLNCQLL
jgi:hypothetical protein